jgi:hypothetical protein
LWAAHKKKPRQWGGAKDFRHWVAELETAGLWHCLLLVGTRASSPTSIPPSQRAGDSRQVPMLQRAPNEVKRPASSKRIF